MPCRFALCSCAVGALGYDGQTVSLGPESVCSVEYCGGPSVLLGKAWRASTRSCQCQQHRGDTNGSEISMTIPGLPLTLVDLAARETDAGACGPEISVQPNQSYIVKSGAGIEEPWTLQLAVSSFSPPPAPRPRAGFFRIASPF